VVTIYQNKPAPAYFESMTEAIILASLRDLEANIDARMAAVYDEYEDWYLGGNLVQQYLYRNDKESDDSYSARVRRLANINYLARIVDELVDDAYGEEVTRHYGEPATPAHEETLQDCLSESHIIEEQQDYARSIVLFGKGVANVSFDEDDGLVKVRAVHPGQVAYRTHPNDPKRIVSLVERRSAFGLGGSKFEEVETFWIWTETEFCQLDTKRRFIIPPTPHRYGRVPYVVFRGRGVVGEREGISYVRDVIGIQRLLLNRVSDIDKLTRYQCHGVLVIKGIDDRAVTTGADSFIRLTNPEDNAFFISPNANFAAANESVERLAAMLFEISNVPQSLVRGGQASSGLQLAIEMRPLVRTVQSLRIRSSAGERDLVCCVAAVGRAHDPSRYPDPNAITPEVTFKDDFLPSDKNEEQDRDLVLLNNDPPLMTVRAFIEKHNPDIAGDPGKIDEYLRELKDEAAARGLGAMFGTPIKTSASAASGGSGEPTPPGGLNPPGEHELPGGKTPDVEQDPDAGGDSSETL